MKKILIISPHFPPSNLAAVHRSRLFAQHLPDFGWEPIVLTVDERYYEEKLDANLLGLISNDLHVEKVKALPITKPRLIGDIGLRSFFQLYKKAKKIIIANSVDFLYIPIPSFYVALLGRLLNNKTGIKYGIDYIDPWVHNFPGTEKIFSRHWFSTQFAKILEPIAIKKVSLISGVAAGYYEGVIERNRFLINNKVSFCAMPYGGEKTDHEKLKKLNIPAYLFKKDYSKIKLIYAGAMLPKAYEPLEAIFKAIANNENALKNIEIHFIGTGKRANDPLSFNIKPLAEKYGLWEKIIFEYPARIPYLDVLVHLQISDAVFILGSTEPHYTPSKVYQAILSEKAIFAVLHKESSAVKVIRDSNAGIVLAFNGDLDLKYLQDHFIEELNNFISFQKNFQPSEVNTSKFDKYSAKSITKILADELDKLIK